MACGIFVLSFLFGNIIGEHRRSVSQGYVASVNILVILTHYDVSEVALIVFEIVNVIGDLNVNAGGEYHSNAANVLASAFIDGIKGITRDPDVVRGIDLNGVPLAVVGKLALVDNDIVDGEGILGGYLARALDSDAGSERLLTGIEVVAGVIKQTTLNQNVACNGALTPFGLGRYQKSRIIYVAERAMLERNIGRFDKESAGMSVINHNVIHRIIAGVCAEVVNGNAVVYLTADFGELELLARFLIYECLGIDVARAYLYGVKLARGDFMSIVVFEVVGQYLARELRIGKNGSVDYGLAEGIVSVNAVSLEEVRTFGCLKM